MTHIGAKEKTALDMAKTLRWSNEDEVKVHEQFHDYIKLIQSCNYDCELSTANRIYLQQSFVLLEEFKKKLDTCYQAEPVCADFVHDAENERLKINKWVAEQTKNKINDLLAPGTLHALTRMVLISAIYFKGQWKKVFQVHDTKPLSFKVSPKLTKTVPMMTITDRYSYSKFDDLKITAVQIPYKGEKLGMVILLPDEDFGLENVINNLTWTELGRIFEKLSTSGSKVKLTLPKFEMKTSLDLKPVLSSLGMEVAFNENIANFSGITGNKDLYISEALHKAYIHVNEEGTEATACTSIRHSRKRKHPALPVIHVDHPFLYLIRDMKTNIILFLGQTVDPS
ncbi:Leukocyte elastase inhibitor C [Bulinus truncatus]|nr:Leukocyte elastase inhibitor C [Bulinus truncatus]